MSRGFSAGACLLLVVGLLAAEPPASPADPLIATIRKVGKEGTGNAEASRAWKSLVGLGTDALVPILSAMHDDEDVAGNWLQPAFEAIAEKAAEEGKLSTGPLEKFFADRGKAGCARALAYRWMVKVDENAATRLLPGMLSDPAPELRRQAVDHAVKTAEASLAKDKDEKAARDQYRRAFKAAGDPEQIQAIAKSLDKLGDKADYARQLGVVHRWYLVTPFDNTKGVGFARLYPPEKGVDLTASYTGKGDKKAVWVEYTTKHAEGEVDLKAVLGHLKGTVAYAYAIIDMPETRTVELRAGCITALKMFANGKEVFAREEYHHGSRIDQYSARVTLNKGKNEILLKVCQNEQMEKFAQVWSFQLRICDLVGCGVAFTQSETKKEEK